MKTATAALAAGVLVMMGAGVLATDIVAEIGTARLSLAEVREVFARIRQGDDESATLKTLTPEGRRAILDSLIDEQLLALGARRARVDERPEVRAEIERAVTAILAAEMTRIETESADVSEPVLRAYYAAHAAEFQRRGRVKARHILVASRAQADAVAASLAGGAAFADVALAQSIDPHTRASGGELGWIPTGVMVKPFEDALFALKTGETRVIESVQGFHVVRVDEIQAPAVPPFETVRAEVIQRVRDARMASLLAGLKLDFPVRIYPDALKALER